MAHAGDLLKYLSENAVDFRVVRHPYMFSNDELASALGVPASLVAKTTIVCDSDHYWMAIVPWDHQPDVGALAKVLEAGALRVADAQDAETVCPDSDTNCIPPLGNLYGLKTVVDESFRRAGKIAFRACDNTQSVVMAWEDYRRLARPIVTTLFSEAEVSNAGGQQRTVGTVH